MNNNPYQKSIGDVLSVVTTILKIKSCRIHPGASYVAGMAVAPIWLFDIVKMLDSGSVLLESSRRAAATLLAGYKIGRFNSQSILKPINMTDKELAECMDILLDFLRK